MWEIIDHILDVIAVGGLVAADIIGIIWLVIEVKRYK